MIQTTTGYYSRIECACGRSSGAREAPTHGGPKHENLPLCPHVQTHQSPSRLELVRPALMMKCTKREALRMSIPVCNGCLRWRLSTCGLDLRSGTTLSMLGALLVLGRTVPRRLVCFLACIDFLQGLFVLCIRLVVFMFMLLRLVFLARVF
jgi:hypothetical protein